ncbi:MAG: YcxB family protein [Cytophagales bacterium]|nr:MAG: YcxB family protein [Cytophagales bacterium]
MIIKTKKYQLSKKLYTTLCLKSILKEFWWVWFIPVPIMLLPIFVSGAFWWCFSITLLLIIGYWAFWYLQFTAITQLDQYKIIFEKFSYEIDSRQILMKINAKEGSQITWDKIQKAEKTKEAFVLTLSRAQFIYLPFDLFKNDLELKFIETILRRKGLITTPLKGKEQLEEQEKTEVKK